MALSIDKRFLSQKAGESAPVTSYITRVVPINSGSNVYLNQPIRFRIGGLQANQFLDPMNSFIKMTIKNNSTTKNFHLPVAGGLGLFRQVELTQSGSVLSSFNQFGVMTTMEHKQFMSNEAFTTAGTLYGAGPNHGAAIHANNERTVCMPLTHFSSLFDAGKMIPLFSKDSLELVATLGDKLYGGYWEGAASQMTDITDASLQFVNAEIVMSIVQTAPSVTQSILEKDGGLYVVECKGKSHSGYTIPAGAGSYTINLGLGYSNLEGINFVHLAEKSSVGNITPRIANDVNAYFIRNKLKSYALSVDGTLVEALRPVEVDAQGAEALAMALIQKGVLSDANKQAGSLIGTSTSTGAGSIERWSIDELQTTVGESDTAGIRLQGISTSYISSLDLCAYEQTHGHDICSGRNVLTSATQLVLTYDSPTNDAPLHMFPHFRQVCVLDLNGSGLWNVMM
jgi:hypothetical protein